MIRVLRNSLIAFFVLGLSACSYSPSLLQDMYADIPEELSDELKEAMELTPKQSADIDDYVKQTMKWHRHHKLSEYSQSFAILANHVEKGNITEKSIEDLFYIIDGIPHFEEATHLTPKIALVARSLTANQIIELERHFKSEYLENAAEIRKENLFATESENIKSAFEFLNIELNNEQMALVKRETGKLHDLRWKELELESKSNKQLIALLRKKNNPHFLAQFTQFWNSDDEFPTESLRLKEKQDEMRMIAMMTKLINSFSVQQKGQFLAQLHSISKTLGKMSRE